MTSIPHRCFWDRSHRGPSSLHYALGRLLRSSGRQFACRAERVAEALNKVKGKHPWDANPAQAVAGVSVLWMIKHKKHGEKYENADKNHRTEKAGFNPVFFALCLCS
jgi:hypothetical protein